MGAHQIKTSESTQIIITGKKVIVHEKWNPETLDNDIALIELAHDVKLSGKRLSNNRKYEVLFWSR